MPNTARQSPIPESLHAEFIAWMDGFASAGLAPAARMVLLKEAAQDFIDNHGLDGADCLAAANQYLRLRPPGL